MRRNNGGWSKGDACNTHRAALAFDHARQRQARHERRRDDIEIDEALSVLVGDLHEVLREGVYKPTHMMRYDIQYGIIQDFCPPDIFYQKCGQCFLLCCEFCSCGSPTCSGEAGFFPPNQQGQSQKFSQNLKWNNWHFQRTLNTWPFICFRCAYNCIVNHTNGCDKLVFFAPTTTRKHLCHIHLLGVNGSRNNTVPIHSLT